MNDPKRPNRLANFWRQKRRASIAILTALAVVAAAIIVAIALSSSQPEHPVTSSTSTSTSSTSSTSTTPTTSAPPPSGTGLSVPANKQRVQDVLNQMATHAFNASAPAGKGETAQGGLYINWRAGWNGQSDPSANTNVQETGLSDSQVGSAPRHDPLTDLTYLVSLSAYQTLSGDHTYASQIAQMNPIVAQEFARYGYYRSWIYFQLLDLQQYDPGENWSAMANKFASLVATRFWNPSIGSFYDPTHNTLDGDYVAESAAVVIDAAHRFGGESMTSEGKQAAEFLLTKLANPTTGLIPSTAKVSQGSVTVTNQQVTVGQEAQLLDSLLTVYDGTHDQAILQGVQKAVDSLWSPTTGLYDSVNGGFFSAVNADGTSLHAAYKETRQGWMVPMMEHLQADAGGQNQHVAQMLTVVRDRLWQADANGYFYRVSPTFSPYVSHEAPGHTANVENYVTTEAMGIGSEVLEGLPITWTTGSPQPPSP